MKNFHDTICSKIKTCLSEMEHAVKKGSFDVELVSQLLVSIRTDATNMENALKANKVLRLKHNIDTEYRELIKEKERPSGIDKLPITDSLYTTDRPKYEVTIKNKAGEIEYQHKVHAFIMCSVERIENMDATGIIDGQTNTFAVGSDLAMFYAYDQLKQKFSAKFTQLLLKMANSQRTGKFATRKQRRQFIKAANGQKVK